MGGDVGNVVICLVLGGFGGTLAHLLWMITFGQKKAGGKRQPSSKGAGFRIKLFLLAFAAGLAAAFLVWWWYADQLSANTVSLRAVTFYAALAGLAGGALVDILKKLVRL